MSIESDALTIYGVYPRKVGRRKALEEIRKALIRLAAGETGPRMTLEQALDGLLQATSLYARSPAGQRENFTPHPSTWFHQSRYLDDPKEWFHHEKSAQIERAERNSTAIDRIFNQGRMPENGTGDLWQRLNRVGDKVLVGVPRMLHGTRG
jgi:hypothetical protein